MTNKLFLKDIFKYKLNILLIILLSIISVSLIVLIPLIIGRAVELTNVEGIINFNQIYFYIFLITLFAFLSSILNYIIMLISTVTSHQVVVNLRQKTFTKIHNLPLSYIDAQKKGNLNSLVVNDLQLVIEGLTSILNMLFSSILTIIFSVIMMLILNSIIAIVIIAVSILSLLITRFISKKAYYFIDDSLNKTALYNSYTSQMLSNKFIVTTFNYEDISINTSFTINKELSQARTKAMFYTSLNGPISRFISNMTYLLVGLIGGLIFLNNPDNISIAIITSLLFYANVFSRPLTELATLQTQMVSCTVAYKRVYDFLDIQNDNLKIKDEIIVTKGDVEFKNVFFSYDQHTSLIQDFNLKVKYGQKIAIVGPTGSGKTTLVNLLMGFYDLDKGQILIDNQDISKYSKDSLRKVVGMVLQDTWLKEASIKDNLMYGNENVSFSDVVNVCKQLNIKNFIKKTPNAYDTLISEDFYLLSQGQKQLLAIAIAILIDSKILILDEATSNVDTRTEVLINNALDVLMKNKTSFIIAHRLKTIMNADNIIVLNSGKIIEIGNHKELLLKKGLYFDLFNSQFK